MTQLAIGLKYVSTMQVEDRHTVPQISPDWPGFQDMPPVFATAMLVGFMEQTCIEALRPYLNPGQHTVGTYIDISHTAPTPAGMQVTVVTELIKMEGRKLTFRLTARDAADCISEGLHQRFIIEQDTFLSRVRKKQHDFGCHSYFDKMPT